MSGGDVQVTRGGGVANLSVSGGTLTVVNNTEYRSDTSKNLTIDDSLMLGDPDLAVFVLDITFHDPAPFQVTGEITDTSAGELIFSGGTLIVTAEGDMPDTHFNLEEGTETTLDLTALTSASFGDPLPMREHKLIDPDSAYVTLLASMNEADFNAQQGWMWEMVNGWLELTAVPAGEVDPTEYILLDDDDYEWLDGVGSITLEFRPMPEPGTMLLLGFGALAVLLKKKRRRS